MTNNVTVEDWGLSTLAEDAKALLEQVMDRMAESVADRMRANMAGGGTYSTGKAASSVKVWKAGKGSRELGRNVGPTQFYAYWLETGWVQVVAWGKRLKEVIHHPGRHFAQRALEASDTEFEERISAAMKRLGR